MFVMLDVNFNVSISNLQKNSSHHLRSSSFIGIDTNTQFGGCEFLDMGKDHRFVDLTGKKFNRWTVIKIGTRKIGSNYTWVCKCDCGVIKEVRGAALPSGQSKSCGCLKKEISIIKLSTHGKTDTPTYRSWIKMKTRCFNPNDKQYKDYGGRGITVCDEWLGEYGFEKFLSDMGERPENKTLDRFPDKNGNYCPENCRWATRKEQQRNTRDNVWVEVDGERRFFGDVVEEYGIGYDSVRTHMKKGRNIEDIIAFKMWNKSRAKKIQFDKFIERCK